MGENSEEYSNFVSSSDGFVHADQPVKKSRFLVFLSIFIFLFIILLVFLFLFFKYKNSPLEFSYLQIQNGKEIILSKGQQVKLNINGANEKIILKSIDDNSILLNFVGINKSISLSTDQKINISFNNSKTIQLSVKEINKSKVSIQIRIINVLVSINSSVSNNNSNLTDSSYSISNSTSYLSNDLNCSRKLYCPNWSAECITGYKTRTCFEKDNCDPDYWNVTIEKQSCQLESKTQDLDYCNLIDTINYSLKCDIAATDCYGQPTYQQCFKDLGINESICEDLGSLYGNQYAQCVSLATDERNLDYCDNMLLTLNRNGESMIIKDEAEAERCRIVASAILNDSSYCSNVHRKSNGFEIKVSYEFSNGVSNLFSASDICYTIMSGMTKLNLCEKVITDSLKSECLNNRSWSRNLGDLLLMF